MSFETDVKPVLENRCVVCHACYDGPCQLLFSSPPGIERGATRANVYDTGASMKPRPRGSGSTRRPPRVAREGVRRGLGSDANSLFLRMLALGKSSPFPAGERLPASVGLDIGRTLTCADEDQFGDYAAKHPQGGMPYGMAPLSSVEIGTLASWAMQGAPMPAQSASLPGDAQQQVASWEGFLNGDSLKQRVVARYLYEHWFVAHLYFDGLSAGPFFKAGALRARRAASRSTRSRRGAPTTIRARRSTTACSRSNRRSSTRPTSLYALSPARMARLRQALPLGGLAANAIPQLCADVASNPFVAFAEIPARSRYQYLLDDAHFFVDTFIRGPVCRGQVAVDVIEDQFLGARSSIPTTIFRSRIRSIWRKRSSCAEPAVRRRRLDRVQPQATPVSE